MSTAPTPYRVLAAAALMATYMQTLNISLPNAALLHIQGALSMSDDEVGWVFSSYIAASVVTMPMTRWLAGSFGRKLVCLLSLALFALGLVLATLAQTPLQFVGARIVQGAASGTLAPLSLAILLDILPPARHARISLLWSVASVLGIVSGPSIGGWIAEYHGWRPLFYLSLPMVGFIFLVVSLSLAEKKAAQNTPFDFFGLITFTLGMIGLQMVLDRGERLEWFDWPRSGRRRRPQPWGSIYISYISSRQRFICSTRRCLGTATSCCPQSYSLPSDSSCCRPWP